MLDGVHLIDKEASREYLLGMTQHAIGGFGKLPGEPPGLCGLNFPIPFQGILRSEA
jgi:prenyltransferase beta subunit